MEKNAILVKKIKPIKIESPRKEIIHNLLEYSRSVITIKLDSVSFIYQNN